jgi:leader peptidase (prepilin peptidase)/N-methyltransferase
MIWPLALAGAVAGAVAGSFIATIAIRWPQGRSVMRGRSACDACGRTLGIVDLIPLLGFLIRRGRCVECGAPIDRRHPIVELAAALIGGTALAASSDIAGAAGALFGWLLLLLALLDIDHHWLPDRLTATLAATGIAAGLLGIGPPLADRLIGAVAGFASLAVIAVTYRAVRRREGMGGGDPKLFGAIGAWLGWHALPFVLLGASVVGLIAVLVAVARRQPMSRTTRLPFGALLAVAAFPVWVVMA